MARTVLCGASLLLIAPLLLWLGFTQPLWHVLGLVLLLGVAAGLWKLVSRTVVAQRKRATLQ